MGKQINLQMILFALLVVGLCVLIAGCGEGPIATPKETAEPELMSVVEIPEDGFSLGGKTADDGDSDGLSRDEKTTGTQTIEPGVGGTFTLGRFTVTIPPDAITESISLSIKDFSISTGYIVVNLGPHGYEFEKPVTLTMDLNGTNIADYGDATIVWYDEKNKVWVDLDGTYDPTTETVSTELDHFSKYGASGRAGW